MVLLFQGGCFANRMAKTMEIFPFSKKQVNTRPGRIGKKIGKHSHTVTHTLTQSLDFFRARYESLSSAEKNYSKNILIDRKIFK